MRLTEKVVRRVAEYAEEISGGKFRLGNVGGDIGHGTRYMDSTRELVWLGRHGAAEAIAYYGAAIETYNSEVRHGTLADIPEDIRTAIRTAVRAPKYDAEYSRGVGDAVSRIRFARDNPNDIA